MSQTTGKPHVMLFDLYHGGHHAQYLLQLMRYWKQHEAKGQLDVVVSPKLLEKHPALEKEAHEDAGIRIVMAPPPAFSTQGGTRALLHNDAEHGRLLRKMIEEHRPDHVLLMYVDHVQVSLARGLRLGYPIQISGIYFRPSFHYPALEGRAPSIKEWLKGQRKVWQLRAALRNPHVHALLCLDPFSVGVIKPWAPKKNIVALPDGIEPGPAAVSGEAVRERWHVEPGRKLLLLFGALSERKGVYALLAALGKLDDEVAEHACVLLVGAVEPGDRARIQEGLEALKTSPLQVMLHDGYVEDATMHALLHASDVVLLPYQQHIGSSGVLIRAAAAGKPVLGDAYGMLGALLRERRLGIAVDATNEAALVDGLRRCIIEAPAALFDADEANRFAAENTAEQFGRVIFQQIAPGAFDA